MMSEVICDWVNLCVLDYLFGFLEYRYENAGAYVVKRVCRGWKGCVVKRFELMLQGYDGIDVRKFFKCINMGSVRKLCFGGYDGCVMNRCFKWDVANMGNLVELNVGGFVLDDDCMISLCGLSKLKVLKLEGCSGSVDWCGLAASLELLVELNLSGCGEVVTDDVLSAFGETLCILDVSYCYKIGRRNGFGGMKGLIELNVRGCEIGDECIEWVCGLVGLRKLDISCNRITDEGLIFVANRLSGLRCLNLEGCWGVEDRGVSELEKLKELEELILVESCVSDGGIVEMVRRRMFLKLRRLGVSWIKG